MQSIRSFREFALRGNEESLVFNGFVCNFEF